MFICVYISVTMGTVLRVRGWQWWRVSVGGAKMRCLVWTLRRGRDSDATESATEKWPVVAIDVTRSAAVYVCVCARVSVCLCVWECVCDSLGGRSWVQACVWSTAAMRPPPLSGVVSLSWVWSMLAVQWVIYCKMLYSSAYVCITDTVFHTKRVENWFLDT